MKNMSIFSFVIAYISLLCVYVFDSEWDTISFHVAHIFGMLDGWKICLGQLPARNRRSVSSHVCANRRCDESAHGDPHEVCKRIDISICHYRSFHALTTALFSDIWRRHLKSCATLPSAWSLCLCDSFGDSTPPVMLPALLNGFSIGILDCFCWFHQADTWCFMIKLICFILHFRTTENSLTGSDWKFTIIQTIVVHPGFTTRVPAAMRESFETYHRQGRFYARAQARVLIEDKFFWKLSDQSTCCCKWKSTCKWNTPAERNGISTTNYEINGKIYGRMRTITIAVRRWLLARNRHAVPEPSWPRCCRGARLRDCRWSNQECRWSDAFKKKSHTTHTSE